MHFEFLITYMQKEITWDIRFSFKYILFFLQKMPHFQRKKTSHYGERCFLVTPISTAGVFSQIFATNPTAQGLGNNLLYGSVGSYRKSMKYGHPQKFLFSMLEVISQWQWHIMKHGNSVHHEFKTILKSERPQILVRMCVMLRHYALN